MKKFLYPYIAIILILSIATILFLILQKSSQIQNSQEKKPELPLNEKLTGEKTGKIIVKTQSGDVEIDDIYSISEEIISGNATIETTPEYQIVYSGERQNFIISILSPDLQSTRDKAEQKFLELLGVNKDKACSLEVTLSVSKDASPNAAGQNYGLSFCPNGKSLQAE